MYAYIASLIFQQDTMFLFHINDPLLSYTLISWEIISLVECLSN